MVQRTILMVDDNEVERLIFRRVIARHMPDCRVVTAADGEEGLWLALTEQPDCAVIDLVMPGMDGIELCRRLKGREQTAHFPVLLVTALEMNAELRAQGLDAGADEFLQRPSEQVDLVAKLRVMLRIKQAEDELRAANRRLTDLAEDRSKDLRFRDQQFRMMFDVCSDAVLVCRVDAGIGRGASICGANDAACKLTGIGHEHLKGRNPVSLFGAEPMIAARIEGLARNKFDHFEATLLRGDGRSIPVAVHSGFFDDEAECQVLLVIRAVPDRGAVAYEGGVDIGYSLLAVETGQVLYDHFLSMDQVIWDGAMEQVTGRPGSEFQHRPMQVWRDQVHPEDRPLLEQKIHEAVETLGRYQLEYRIFHASGATRHVEEMGLVLPGEDGAAYRVLGTIKDITGRVEAERERRRQDQEAMHSKRLESLGVLAGGVAHDFNNLLTGIIGLTDLCLSHMDPEDENYGDLKEALQAGHRAKELVRQILAFSRQSDMEKSPLRLHLVARECLKLLRGSLPSHIEIVDSVDVNSGSVYANATQMHQVIMNCCTNAIQAMSQGGGKLEVRVEDVEVDDRLAWAHPRLGVGGYVKLSIVDQGTGMPPEVLSRVFDPFFTTKGPGQGTGMGLAAVHGIVTEHEGTVVAESVPGRGSTITVYLPRMDSQTEYKPGAEQASPKGSGHILVVDDEAAVLRFAIKALRRAGYEATACDSGAEALRRFRENPGGYDAVLTDQGMPEMSGSVLAAALKEIRPDLPVVLLTGFQQPLSDEWIREAGFVRVLRKPVLAAELAWSIHDLLAEARQGV